MTQRPWRTLFAGLAFGAAGALVGYLAVQTGLTAGRRAELQLWHAPAISIMLLLVIAWHEFGHVVGGWMAGFQLTLFIVGPLKIERIHDRLQMRWNGKLSLAGGLAATAPLGGILPGAEEMKRALLRIVAFGPLFSLIGGIVLWILAETALHWAPAAMLPLRFGAVGSLAIALGTMIPMGSGGFQSDGARVLQMIRGGADADRWACLVTLSSLAYTSRPRDWPGSLIARVAARDRDGYDAVSGAWLAACHYDDSGDWHEARFWAEKAIAGEESWPEAARGMLHYTAACILARLGDTQEAHQRLNRVQPGGFLPRESRHHAEALILFAEGKVPQARSAAGKAMALLPARPSPATQPMRDDLIRIGSEITQ